MSTHGNAVWGKAASMVVPSGYPGGTTSSQMEMCLSPAKQIAMGPPQSTPIAERAS